MNGNSWGNTNLLKKSRKKTAFFLGVKLATWTKQCWEKKLSPSFRRKAGVLYVVLWNSCWVSLTSDWQPKALATEIGFKLIKIWLKPSIAPKWIVANVRCFFNMYQLRPFVIPKWIHNAQWIAVCFQVKVYLGWVKAAKFCFGICEYVAISVSNCQALRCWCFSSCLWFHLLCFSRPLKSWGTLGGISSAIFRGFVWFVLTFLTWWTLFLVEEAEASTFHLAFSGASGPWSVTATGIHPGRGPVPWLFLPKDGPLPNWSDICIRRKAKLLWYCLALVHIFFGNLESGLVMAG